MDSKTDLLSELRIDGDMKEAPSHMPRYLFLLAVAGIMAAGAWYWVKPETAPVQIRTVEVATVSMTRAAAADDSVLDATGYVTARRKATVSSKVTGKVLEIFIEEGVVVKQGDILAKLDSSTEEAQLELSRRQMQASATAMSEVQVMLEEADLNYTRTVELADKQMASEADLDQAKLAAAALRARLARFDRELDVARQRVEVQQRFVDDTSIRAPFDGVVIFKAAQPGEMISPVTGGGGFTATGICTLVDMASLEIEVDVKESYINRVSPGQPVKANLNSYPNWDIPAEVIAIIPAADRSKATVRVRIGFLVTDDRILPDMGIKVAFLIDTSEAAEVVEEEDVASIVLPSSAIAYDELGAFVFIVASGETSRRDIKVGPQMGKRRSVLGGVSVGEKAVLDLNDELIAQLQGGAPITIVN